MKYSFKEIVDLELLQKFTDNLYAAFELPSAVITIDGKILTRSGWQEICTEFHRNHPETEEVCIQSDSTLHEMSRQGKKYCVYRCPHGLIDSSSPIFLDGKHVANVFTGQFFSTPPTKETETRFREQAKLHGFDEEAYMAAFRKIPVFPEEKHHLMLDVLVNFATMLGDIGFTRKREIEKTEALKNKCNQIEQERSLFIGGVVVVFKWKNQENWPVEYVSSNVKEVFGFSADEFMTGDIVYSSIIPEEDIERVTHEVTSACDSKATEFTHEPYRIVRKDGKAIWLSDYTTIIRDESGAITHFLGYVLDITERKRSEEALRQSEERFKKLSNLTFEGVLIHENGVAVDINESLAGIVGYAREEIIGVNIIELCVPQKYHAIISENIARQYAKPYEIEVIRKDGTIVPVEVEAKTINDKAGEYRVTAIRDITERKQAQEALRLSEENLRSIFENMQDVYYRLDANGYILAASPSVVELYKCDSLDEIIGKHATDFVYNVEDNDRLIEELHREGAVKNYEIKHKCKNGEPIIIETNTNVILNDQGDLKGAIGVFRDITERKQAEEALRESEHKLTEAQSIAKLGYYVLDIKAGTWSNSIELDSIFGIDNDFEKNIAGWLKIIHPDFRATMTNYLQDNILIQHQMFNKEYRIIDIKTGLEKWVHGLGNLRFDDNGEIIEMFGTIQDITEKKKSEKALRKSEEKFRKYVSSAPDGIYIADSQGHYVDVNEAACTMTGYSRTELLSMSIAELVDPDSVKVVIEDFKRLKRVGQLKLEIKLKRKDGSIFLASHDTVVLSENRFMAFCTDITETRRLQELESRAARLETAGTIAGQVAHDFNNLLAPLIAYPEFIRDELPKNHPTLQYVEQMEQAALKIAEINQDLLTMGRRGHYNQSALNLNTIVQQAVTELKPHPEKLVCETILCEDLKDVYGGGAQLHRMISNILNNAKDAMQEIGQLTIKTENYYVDQISVVYGFVPKGEYVKLTITDTGCGIPDDIVHKIFDPFFTSKTTDKRRGSGLGMSVVDAVIKDHNGFIDLSTKIGQGTSFYIYLPVTQVLQSDEESILSGGGDETILIVDDDDVQRKVSTQVIKKLGYQVTTVDSGEKAVALLKEHPQSLIVLDMVMPGSIDGAETYRQILEINPDQKAIVLSGFSESGRVLEAQKLGAGAFVKKPVSKKGIAKAIRTELDRVRTKT